MSKESKESNFSVTHSQVTKPANFTAQLRCSELISAFHPDMSLLCMNRSEILSTR